MSLSIHVRRQDEAATVEAHSMASSAENLGVDSKESPDPVDPLRERYPHLCSVEHTQRETVHRAKR